MRVTVIGCGYLGVTHAAGMAELGYEVLGVEVDQHKLTELSEGRAPFYEPDLDDLLRRHVESGALRFTDSFEEAGAFGDVHFLCVGTPQQANGLGCRHEPGGGGRRGPRPACEGRRRSSSASRPSRSAPPRA